MMVGGRVVTLGEFMDSMREARGNGRRMVGVIVYSADNWDREYSLESRSYVVENGSHAFEDGKISNAMYGSALDGTDSNVRLDRYNWHVDYCII